MYLICWIIQWSLTPSLDFKLALLWTFDNPSRISVSATTNEGCDAVSSSSRDVWIVLKSESVRHNNLGSALLDRNHTEEYD